MAARSKLLGRQEESLAAQSIILTAGRAVGFVMTFAIPLVLVRVFDQATFGLYKQIFLISGTAIPILSLGMYASLYYFVPRDHDGGHRFIVQALGVLSVTGGLAGLALTLGADQVGALFGTSELRDYLPLLGLFVFLATPTEIVTSVPVLDKRPMLAAYTTAGSDLVRAGGIIGAAVIGRSVTAVVWAVIITALLRGAWLLLYVRLRQEEAKPGRANLMDLGSQFKYALPFAAAVLFEIGLRRFHEMYVAANVSTAEFAIYAVGIFNIPLLGVMVHSVVEVMIVRGTVAYREGDHGELRRVWRIAVERLAALILPFWALAQLFATDLIGVLFGAAYLPAVPIFRLFLSTLLLRIVVDHGILRATNDTGFVFKANTVGFVASVIAVIVCTRFSVLLGGVVGYIVGLLVMRGAGVARVARRLELSWHELVPWASFGRTAAAVAAAVAVASVAHVIPNQIVRPAAGALLFGTTYLVLSYSWQVFPRKEVRALLRRFGARRFVQA